MLSGKGSIGGATINSGGTLAPGFRSNITAAGLLTANGNVGFTDNTSTFLIWLGVIEPTDDDELSVTGTLSLNGATLSIQTGQAYNTALANGFTYIILNGGYVTGTSGFFAQGDTVTASNGDVFNILYGYDGSDIALQLASVPEPGTWAMMLSGAGILIALRRMRPRLD
jgi:hypothetical protein